MKLSSVRPANHERTLHRSGHRFFHKVLARLSRPLPQACADLRARSQPPNPRNSSLTAADRSRHGCHESLHESPFCCRPCHRTFTHLVPAPRALARFSTCSTRSIPYIYPTYPPPSPQLCAAPRSLAAPLASARPCRLALLSTCATHAYAKSSHTPASAPIPLLLGECSATSSEHVVPAPAPGSGLGRTIYW